MILTRLALHNFKNFNQLEVEFSTKIIGFVGNNGEGKTNLLDAIYFLSNGKSYLSSSDNQNLRHNEAFFSILSLWKNESEEIVELQCAFKPGTKKKIKLNKKEYTKLSDHIGKFPVVFISPYDGDLIAEGSEMRRKWMDSILSHFSREYLTHLQSYNRALEQRNRLLKNFHENRYFDKESLEVWDDQLIEHGSHIFEERKLFVNEFLDYFQRIYSQIATTSEQIDIEFQSKLLTTSYNELLEENLKKDLAVQYTSVGIHKDDLLFKLNGHPIKKYGSQGQQKSFLIALRIAQYTWLKEHLKVSPVLLLDDIFDKLDRQRVTKLVALVAEGYFGQIFISDTDKERMTELFSSMPISTELFEIANGNIHPITLHEKR